MASEPLSSIRSWPIVITIADSNYAIEPLPALPWLEILLSDPVNILDVVPGLMDFDDQLIVTDLLAEDELGFDELRQVVFDTITVAAGRPWWWCLNLLYASKSAWGWLYGQLVLAGVDPQIKTLAAFLDALYFLCVKDLPEDKRKLFDLDLMTPPPNISQELDEDAEGEAFMRMMQEAQQLPNG